jgi:hypothetical protein
VAGKGDFLPIFLSRRATIELAAQLSDQAEGDATRAVNLLQPATASGTFSTNLGRAYRILGRSLQTRGKRDEARAAFRSATENLEHTLGSGHPETRTARQLAELDNPQIKS